MQNTILSSIIISIMLFLMLAGQATASYRIELESGKSVITRYYWEEDGWIMFYRYDGVVGYPARLVRDIRESDRPPPDEIMDEEVEEADGGNLYMNEANLTEEAEPTETEMDPEEFERKVEQYQEELKRNLREQNIHFQDYESAKFREDEPAMEDAEKKLRSLQEQRNLLRRNVLGIYQNIQPQWWDDIINEYASGPHQPYANIP